MIGLRRMDNIQYCVETALNDEVSGDLIETGVWRGGATIFMRAILKVRGDTSRKVWVADSFAGLPEPDVQRYPADKDDSFYKLDNLRVGVERVRHNFERYGLLDDQVRFLVGWFSESLADAPIDQIAVLGLNGDMYESTTQAIEALYPKLSTGGFCIVDDYWVVPGCRQAISDYRAAKDMQDEIIDIYGVGVYWRKGASGWPGGRPRDAVLRAATVDWGRGGARVTVCPRLGQTDLDLAARAGFRTAGPGVHPGWRIRPRPRSRWLRRGPT